MIMLEQKRPGEWYIFNDHGVDPIPVPSWIVEQCPVEDRPLLARELAGIFGFGRRLGKTEGKENTQRQMREVLGL